LYRECLAGAQINFPESGRGLGHVPLTIFGSTVGYPSDSLASCYSKEMKIHLRTLFSRNIAYYTTLIDATTLLDVGRVLIYSSL